MRKAIEHGVWNNIIADRARVTRNAIRIGRTK